MIKWMVLALISLSAYAAPKSLEVWFVSNAKVSELLHYIKDPPMIYRPLTAELECQVMGDFCFDPQYGLYKKDDANKEVDQTIVTAESGPVIPPGKSVDRELVECDQKNYFFDVFCGKAKKEVEANTKLDLWIDTSSSMREFDFSDKEGGCHRKSMLRKLDDTCGFNRKVNVMMFDTSLKQAGSMDQVCTNQGLNDYKRLMDWIERFEGQKLVVITDIYEFHKEFSDFVEKKDGKLRGDKDPLTAAQLVALADTLAKSCQ